MKRPVHPMPDDVARALAYHRLTDACNARPPYERNDYIGCITRAKRAGTRTKRIEQMLDELTRGDLHMRMKYTPTRKMT